MTTKTRTKTTDSDIAPAMLSRSAAARYLSLAESTLRDWYAQSIGPRPTKLGTKRQSRIFYAREELDRWRADPVSYDRGGRPASVPSFAPPRRGNEKRGPQS